jgi:ribulose-phosphate 3-epimerase
VIFKIAPSILAADFTQLGNQLGDAQVAKADLIHIDVMDGHFVPNLTFGALMVEACKRATTVPLDVHLMITQPERYITEFVEAGANIITIHAEATPHVHRTLEMIKEKGIQAGLAVNPLTPLDMMHDAIKYCNLDLALVMSVNPGFGGQSFIESTLPRVRQVRDWCNELISSCDIEVDGGINDHTIAKVASAGANVFVAGSAVFNQEASVAENIRQLRTKLGEVRT